VGGEGFYKMDEAGAAGEALRGRVLFMRECEVRRHSAFHTRKIHAPIGFVSFDLGTITYQTSTRDAFRFVR